MEPNLTVVPRHVAIIMDGNGRWATRRGLPRTMGHRAGVESLREIVRASSDWGVEYLTVYAFSTENWRRSQEEVSGIFRLLLEYLAHETTELIRNNVRIRIIGRREGLPQKVLEAIALAEERSAACTGLVFNVALNYGARAELVDAMRALAGKVRAGELAPEAITEQTIADHLTTAGQPDPDLLIRTGGDYRISNFMLYQLSYSEMAVLDTLWPDMTREIYGQTLENFGKRQRRFGAAPPEEAK